MKEFGIVCICSLILLLGGVIGIIKGYELGTNNQHNCIKVKK